MGRSRSKTSSPDGRPRVQPRPYSWRDQERHETPGIALWGRKGIAAHLTHHEARTLADSLHDMADQLEEETR